MNIIKPFPIMKLQVDKSLMTYFMNFGQVQDLFSTMWFIDGPKEKIIVDTGCSADTINSHGFPSVQLSYPADALGKIGLKPADIDIVILTQMHLDHVEFAGQFSNAKIIVQKAEYDHAMDPHPIQAGLYIREMYANLKNFELVEGDVEVAEGVKVLHTPGHTPGSQSIAVTTDKGKVIISGLCTVSDNLYPPEETGAFVITPGIHTNATQAYDSLSRVKELADIAVPLHDLKFSCKGTIPW